MKSLVIGSIKQFQEFPHSHSTNLRHSPIYKSGWINHTKARQIQIGITQKPENYGHPGSIRVDSVSQKDVYYINAVDEINDYLKNYSNEKLDIIAYSHTDNEWAEIMRKEEDKLFTEIRKYNRKG